MLGCGGCSAATDEGHDSSQADDDDSSQADDDDSAVSHDPGDPTCHAGFTDMPGTQAHEHDLVEWRSADGTTWLEHRLFQACADVPSLAHDGADTWLAVFQSFQDRQDQTRFDKVALRRSSDGGESWTAAAPINLIGLPAEAARPFDPTIVWVPSEAQWRLYFSMRMSGSLELDENVCTHSAVSVDGADFYYEDGTRFCADGGPVIDPAVGLLGDTWYYSAPRGAPQDGAHLASSMDALVFVEGTPILSDNNHAWTGNFVEVDGGLRFYGREVLFPNGNLLWWSSTTDGLSWSDYTQTNIPAGKDPGVMRRPDGSFVMLVPTQLD
ncbi:MAG: hypothetical protein CMP23_11445 [Rickettsiales bacterium]|nr:hypothetical protein [Rickettsiales bacterium]